MYYQINVFMKVRIIRASLVPAPFIAGKLIQSAGWLNPTSYEDTGKLMRPRFP